MMKKVALLLSFFAATSLLSTAALADCSTPTGGACIGSFCWTEWAHALTTSGCWTANNLTTSSSSCFYNWTAYDFKYFNGTLTRQSLTVPANSSTHWEVSFDFQLTDPTTSWWNQIDATVSVYHPNSGTTSYYDFYNHNGTQGDVCTQPYVDFYASAGDVITVEFTGSGTNTSGSDVLVPQVSIFNITP